MLKAVCIDLIPCIIDDKNLYADVWKKVLKNNYELYASNEVLSSFLTSDLTPSLEQRFLQYMDNNSVAIDICNQFKTIKNKVFKNFFEEYKFNENFITFTKDAKIADCYVILVNNDELWSKYLKMLNLPENTYLSYEFGNLSIDNIETVLESKEIALNEFIYITNDGYVINQMQEKNYFYVRIDKKSESNLADHVVGSMDELTFGELSFNFYDNDVSGGI